MNRSAQGDDLSALRQLGRLHPEVATFQGWIRDQLMVRRDPAGVLLSTVHRVKGQEWPHVVAHLVDDDQYPHRLAEDVEEERRLLHVAITRCRDHVTIVSSEHPSPFVAELTTEPPEHLPEPPPRAAARVSASSSSSSRDAPDHPLLDRSLVMAVPGLVLVDQGQEWTVTELEPEAAVAERDGAVRRFRIGSKVETAGRQRGKLGARPGGVQEASVVVFDLLRSFRDRAREGKPAYTVFDDKTLAGIATALPADLADLARVKGVGPAKLEQYGDDVLEIVANAADAS
jgi:DNA helicase-2/ATP-dependent DNA helicase PcrA